MIKVRGDMVCQRADLLMNVKRWFLSEALRQKREHAVASLITQHTLGKQIGKLLGVIIMVLSSQ